MALYEEPKATWDKRYKQKHYAYRDFEQRATRVLTAAEIAAINVLINSYVTNPTSANWGALLAYLALLIPPVGGIVYLFGTNASAISTVNWPTGCYGREVMVNCDQDVWVRIVSVNLYYLALKAAGKTDAEIATLGIPQTIIEAEEFIPKGAYITFYPTLGAAIIFRADSVAGTLNVWIEGNVEGTD